jgi:acid phosphatase family membrane protein YuiD
MFDVFDDKPFLVAIVAGAGAQLLKVITFLVAERRINYRRLVQAHGAPNMHSAAFAALAVAVGKLDGFGSLTFALAVCLTAVTTVDTMNVKNAASRQAEAVLLIMDRVRQRAPRPDDRTPRLSYSPADVLSGVVLGVIVAMVLL